MPNLVKETQMLYNTKGQRTHVIMPIKKYQELLELLEDANDVKAIREVEHDKTVPLEEVRKELRRKRRM
jgi:hypothetical protein